MKKYCKIYFNEHNSLSQLRGMKADFDVINIE